VKPAGHSAACSCRRCIDPEALKLLDRFAERSPVKSERQKVIAQLEFALRELAKVSCLAGCPLAAKPTPSGPGTCARCKAHGALWNLREDLSRQERLEAGRRDAHEGRRQER
jgi:hypothetical protein